MEELKLQGKVIKSIDVDGNGIELVTEDGYCLEYSASDGGYSCWDIYKKTEGEQ